MTIRRSSRAQRLRLVRAQARLTTAAESRLMAALAPVLASGASASTVAKLLLTAMLDVALRSAEASSADLKSAVPLLETKRDTRAALTARIKAILRKQAVAKAKSISATSRRRAASLLARYSDRSPAEAARLMRNDMSTMSRSQARTIARTELHSASMLGQQESMDEVAEATGLRMRKEWVSSNDDRTRDAHAEADGQIVDLDDTFTVGEEELRFPGDPDADPSETINCRCTVIYHTE